MLTDARPVDGYRLQVIIVFNRYPAKRRRSADNTNLPIHSRFIFGACCIHTVTYISIKDSVKSSYILFAASVPIRSAVISGVPV